MSDENLSTRSKIEELRVVQLHHEAALAVSMLLYIAGLLTVAAVVGVLLLCGVITP